MAGQLPLVAGTCAAALRFAAQQLCCAVDDHAQAAAHAQQVRLTIAAHQIATPATSAAASEAFILLGSLIYAHYYGAQDLCQRPNVVRSAALHTRSQQESVELMSIMSGGKRGATAAACSALSRAVPLPDLARLT
jgi:hypothetical protein